MKNRYLRNFPGLLFTGVLIGLFIVASTASARGGGFETGNGGGGIDCPAPHKKLQILDYFELSKRTDLHFVASTEKTWQDKTADLISRLAKNNPVRADLYHSWLGDFTAETKFLKGEHLMPTSDIGVIPIPNGCSYVQIAAQIEPDASNPQRYLVDDELWSRLDDNEKAGLVLHELTWREARNQTPAHADARFIRGFVEWLSSKEISTLTLEDYVGVLQSVRLADAQIQNGIQISLPVCFSAPCKASGPVFSTPSLAREADLVSQIIVIPWITLEEEMSFPFQVQAYLQSESRAEFLSTGEPAQFDVVRMINPRAVRPDASFGFTLVNHSLMVMTGVNNKVPSAIHVRQSEKSGDRWVELTPSFPFSGAAQVSDFISTVKDASTPQKNCYKRVEMNYTKGKLTACDSF